MYDGGCAISAHVEWCVIVLIFGVSYVYYVIIQLKSIYKYLVTVTSKRCG